MELSRKIKDSCINFFQVPERYSEEQLAPHVVGYVDRTGHGVTGVELAMDDLLGRSSGEVTVYYQVDALGRVIPVRRKKIVDTLEETKAGVVLTLDSKNTAFGAGCIGEAGERGGGSYRGAGRGRYGRLPACRAIPQTTWAARRQRMRILLW